MCCVKLGCVLDVCDVLCQSKLCVGRVSCYAACYVLCVCVYIYIYISLALSCYSDVMLCLCVLACVMLCPQHSSCLEEAVVGICGPPAPLEERYRMSAAAYLTQTLISCHVNKTITIT